MKDILDLGLDRDLGFSQGHQGHQGHERHHPHDDDNNDKDDNEVEDNDKDDDNNNDKGISALGLDRDMGFSKEHQGHQEHWTQVFFGTGLDLVLNSLSQPWD